MVGANLEQYCDKAILEGATDAKVIHPSSVVTAQWVRAKCLFGCPYKINYTCPPQTPTPDETRKILDSYSRAILFHIESSHSKERGKRNMAFLEMLVNLEG